MEYTIELLISLQKLDLCVEDRRKFIQGFEESLADLDRESEQTRQTVTQKQEQLEQAKKSLRRAERSLEQGEEMLAQAQVKLSNSKTNREYEAGLKEIEEQKQRNSDLEGEILKLMDDVEELEQLVSEADKEQAAKQQELTQRKKDLDQIRERAEKEISHAQFERKKVAPDLPPEVLELYDRLRGHWGDPVVVRAVEETCTACHFRMPAQMYNEVLKGERLINCNHCQRFLIIREKDLKEELEPLQAG